MDSSSEADGLRLDKIEKTILRQKEFIRRVPDPDNRAAAESNLITLVQLRDQLLARVSRSTER